MFLEMLVGCLQIAVILWVEARNFNKSLEDHQQTLAEDVYVGERSESWGWSFKLKHLQTFNKFILDLCLAHDFGKHLGDLHLLNRKTPLRCRTTGLLPTCTNSWHRQVISFIVHPCGWEVHSNHRETFPLKRFAKYHQESSIFWVRYVLRWFSSKSMWIH